MCFRHPFCSDQVKSTKTQKAQLHSGIQEYISFKKTHAEKWTLSIFHSSYLLYIMAEWYDACVQHSAWSGECGGGYVHFRCQRQFDEWPKLSLQSAATSVGLFAKFCWTVSVDQTSTVISFQSNLNEASIDLWQSFKSYTRTLDLFWLILLSPSAPGLVTSQSYLNWAHWFIKTKK